MTYEEALHEISVMAHMEAKDDISMRISKDCYKILVQSLEKQIQKKPNLWCGEITTCPNCLRAISQTEALDVHCKYCGQFIDWSDGE